MIGITPNASIFETISAISTVIPSILEQSFSMGVRGLTTYIGQNADRYMDPFELHDCDLVIDGDSLSSNLYKWVSNCNSAFGGNYDQYYRTVCSFFEMLRQCNVVAYVLLDGGYLPKKLSTVRQRLRAKIGAIKYLNPFDAKPMFPIMMREVFVEALEHCGIPFMRCLFEADDEVAALARRLQCPVLSYDSDFYIHNVMYIPSVTLNFRVFRRSIPTSAGKGRQRQRKDLVQQILENGETCKFKMKKVEEDHALAEKVSYYYMDCALYRIENLVREKRLRAEMLPLFAVLLGNDYISSSLFRKFYSNVSMKRTGKNDTPQGKRIVAILRWLQTETRETAISKIIGHVEKEKKQWLQQQMQSAMDGYSQEHSEAYVYFGFASGDRTPLKRCYSFSSESTASDETEESVGDTSDANEKSDTGIVLSEHSDKENADENVDIQFAGKPGHFEAPAWLKPKLLNATLPRQIIDLLHLKLYVNSPQVENFLLPDCNVIAVDILRLIFTILHAPNKPELRYLTRVQRRTDIEYKRFECIADDVRFDSSQSDNFETFKFMFNCFDDATAFIDAIEAASMPPELRMFYLAIIYWSRKSAHMNIVHISSLILNYMVLSVIDGRLEPIRLRQKFEKTYRPQEIKQKKSPNVVISNEEPVASIEECLKSITRDDCILAQSNLLDLFEVSGKLRAKHTEFSSQILHGFAEFQSIVYQMNCLNVLCGEHLAKIRMSDFYNGCFLYNAYVALKERPNVRYYVQHFLFPNSPNMFRLYEAMLAVLAPFVQCISSQTISKRRKKRNINKKKARELRKSQEQATPASQDEVNDKASSGGSDYEDLNNKFSCLLKM